LSFNSVIVDYLPSLTIRSNNTNLWNSFSDKMIRHKIGIYFIQYDDDDDDGGDSDDYQDM